MRHRVRPASLNGWPIEQMPPQAPARHPRRGNAPSADL